MSQYRTFTAQDAVEYARQFGGLDDPSSLVEAQEVGDGNLNLVFKIFDSAGVSRIIVKQALPYVRLAADAGSRPPRGANPGRALPAQPAAHRENPPL